MNDRIVARIQKLLDLANSANEHEAQAAAAKAHALLVALLLARNNERKSK